MQTTKNSALARAIETNLFAKFADLPACVPHMQVLYEQDVTIVDSGLPSETFNIVCHARFDPAYAAQRIAWVVDYFQTKKLPFAWWTGPNTTPSDIASLLTREGLVCTEQEIGMSLALQEFSEQERQATDLVIKHVMSPLQMGLFASACDGFDPYAAQFYHQIEQLNLYKNRPRAFFVGLLAGKPVCSASLLYTHDVVGVHDLFTFPQYRGQGYGRAMMRAALAHAKKQNYKTAVLAASDMGVEIYRRLGFQPCCTFHVYEKQKQ